MHSTLALDKFVKSSNRIDLPYIELDCKSFIVYFQILNYILPPENFIYMRIILARIIAAPVKVCIYINEHFKIKLWGYQNQKSKHKNIHIYG